METKTIEENTIFGRTKETIAHFCVSEMTLWRWRQDPTFPRPIKRGRTVLFDLTAIEQWLKEA